MGAGLPKLLVSSSYKSQRKSYTRKEKRGRKREGREERLQKKKKDTALREWKKGGEIENTRESNRERRRSTLNRNKGHDKDIAQHHHRLCPLKTRYVCYLSRVL